MVDNELNSPLSNLVTVTPICSDGYTIPAGLPFKVMRESMETYESIKTYGGIVIGTGEHSDYTYGETSYSVYTTDEFKCDAELPSVLMSDNTATAKQLFWRNSPDLWSNTENVLCADSYVKITGVTSIFSFSQKLANYGNLYYVSGSKLYITPSYIPGVTTYYYKKVPATGSVLLSEYIKYPGFSRGFVSSKMTSGSASSQPFQIIYGSRYSGYTYHSDSEHNFSLSNNALSAEITSISPYAFVVTTNSDGTVSSGKIYVGSSGNSSYGGRIQGEFTQLLCETFVVSE